MAFDHAPHVAARDLVIRIPNRNHAATVDALDVIPGDSNQNLLGMNMRQLVCLAVGFMDGFNRIADIDDATAFHPARRRRAPAPR